MNEPRLLVVAVIVIAIVLLLVLSLNLRSAFCSSFYFEIIIKQITGKMDPSRVKMNMLYWVFNCLFLHRLLDCAIDLNVKVMTIFPQKAIGMLASGIHCVTHWRQHLSQKARWGLSFGKGLPISQTSDFLVLIKIPISSLYSNSWAMF